MVSVWLPPFGEVLKRFREAAGLTQEDLADRARMSVQGISALERGARHRPQRQTILLLAEALALSAEDRVLFETSARQRLSSFVAHTDQSPASLSRSPSFPLNKNEQEGIFAQPSSEATSQLIIPSAHDWQAIFSAQPASEGEALSALAILAELRRLPHYFKDVFPLPQSRGISVTLVEGDATFIIYPLELRENNFRLPVAQVASWLNTRLLVVPIWWQDTQRQAYWTNLPNLLLRIGGLRGQESIRLSSATDLERLDTSTPVSVNTFFRWIRVLSKAWPSLQAAKTPWLRDAAFPATLIDVLCDPDILSFLPFSTSMLATLTEHLGGQRQDPTQLFGAIYRAGALALSAPEGGVAWLLQHYRLTDIGQEAKSRLTQHFNHWITQVTHARKTQAADMLRAFGQLVSLLGYRTPGDLRFPPFMAMNTYPLGRLVSLLPPETVLDPLISVLSLDHDPQALLYSAYYLGILNLPQRSQVSQLASQLRERIHTSKEHIGKLWPVVDRQLLFIEAQLGGEKAKEQFLRSLRNKEALRFEVPFNLVYYGRDLPFIQNTLERRLDENKRSDQFVKEILGLVYEEVHKQLRATPEVLHQPLDPRLWPTE